MKEGWYARRVNRKVTFPAGEMVALSVSALPSPGQMSFARRKKTRETRKRLNTVRYRRGAKFILPSRELDSRGT